MTAEQQRRRVRVWFGQHPIADHRAETDLANDYAKAMGAALCWPPRHQRAIHDRKRDRG
jgi:hypothetical protein